MACWIISVEWYHHMHVSLFCQSCCFMASFLSDHSSSVENILLLVCCFKLMEHRQTNWCSANTPNRLRQSTSIRFPLRRTASARNVKDFFISVSTVFHLFGFSHVIVFMLYQFDISDKNFTFNFAYVNNIPHVNSQFDMWHEIFMWH